MIPQKVECEACHGLVSLSNGQLESHKIRAGDGETAVFCTGKFPRNKTGINVKLISYLTTFGKRFNIWATKHGFMVADIYGGSKEEVIEKMKAKLGNDFPKDFA